MKHSILLILLFFIPVVLPAEESGSVKLQLSPSGSTFFDTKASEMTIYYARGPLLLRHEWDNPDVPNYESPAIFATGIARNGAPQGVMARTSASVRWTAGELE